jgi:hypothetical protein
MRERSVDTMNATPDELQCVGEVGSSLAWSLSAYPVLATRPLAAPMPKGGIWQAWRPAQSP